MPDVPRRLRSKRLGGRSNRDAHDPNSKLHLNLGSRGLGVRRAGPSDSSGLKQSASDASAGSEEAYLGTASTAITSKISPTRLSPARFMLSGSTSHRPMMGSRTSSLSRHSEPTSDGSETEAPSHGQRCGSGTRDATRISGHSGPTPARETAPALTLSSLRPVVVETPHSQGFLSHGNGYRGGAISVVKTDTHADHRLRWLLGDDQDSERAHPTGSSRLANGGDFDALGAAAGAGPDALTRTSQSATEASSKMYRLLGFLKDRSCALHIQARLLREQLALENGRLRIERGVRDEDIGADTLFCLGVLEHGRHQYGAAVAMYRRCLGVVPRHASALAFCAVAIISWRATTDCAAYALDAFGDASAYLSPGEMGKDSQGGPTLEAIVRQIRKELNGTLPDSPGMLQLEVTVRHRL